MINLKRLIASGLLRALNLARAEEEYRQQAILETAADLGRRCQIVPSAIRWKPGAVFKTGDDVRFDGICVFERADASVEIGDRSYFGGLISCAANVFIGSDVMVSQRAFIADHDSHALVFEDRKDDVVHWMQGDKNWDKVPMAPVRICDKAWVGFGVIILKGVMIGEGAVVAAGSVVTRDVPPYTIAAGNPARAVRELPRPA